MATLETTLPQWTAADLVVTDGQTATLKVALAGADHDEAVNLDVPEKLNYTYLSSTPCKFLGRSGSDCLEF